MAATPTPPATPKNFVPSVEMRFASAAAHATKPEIIIFPDGYDSAEIKASMESLKKAKNGPDAKAALEHAADAKTIDLEPARERVVKGTKSDTETVQQFDDQAQLVENGLNKLYPTARQNLIDRLETHLTDKDEFKAMTPDDRKKVIEGILDNPKLQAELGKVLNELGTNRFNMENTVGLEAALTDATKANIHAEAELNLHQMDRSFNQKELDSMDIGKNANEPNAKLLNEYSSQENLSKFQQLKNEKQNLERHLSNLNTALSGQTSKDSDAKQKILNEINSAQSKLNQAVTDLGPHEVAQTLRDRKATLERSIEQSKIKEKELKFNSDNTKNSEDSAKQDLADGKISTDRKTSRIKTRVTTALETATDNFLAHEEAQNMEILENDFNTRVSQQKESRTSEIERITHKAAKERWNRLFHPMNWVNKKSDWLSLMATSDYPDNLLKYFQAKNPELAVLRDPKEIAHVKTLLTRELLQYNFSNPKAISEMSNWQKKVLFDKPWMNDVIKDGLINMKGFQATAEAAVGGPVDAENQADVEKVKQKMSKQDKLMLLMMMLGIITQSAGSSGEETPRS